MVSYERLKTKENVKLFTSKVIVVAYERWSLTRGSKYSDITWETFGILQNCLLRRGGCNWRFDYIVNSLSPESCTCTYQFIHCCSCLLFQGAWIKNRSEFFFGCSEDLSHWATSTHYPRQTLNFHPPSPFQFNMLCHPSGIGKNSLLFWGVDLFYKQ